MILTDTERRFVDSEEGKAAVAKARHQHEMAQAHRGASAVAWTDDMTANVARSLVMQTARQTVRSAAYCADAAQQAPDLIASHEATMKPLRAARYAPVAR